MDHDNDELLRLDDAECWRFLARHFIGRVAVIHLDNPDVFPVNYAVDGESVVFRTAPGTKLALAAARRVAAFEVDEATELFETGTSVVVHGHLSEVTEPGERARLLALPLRPWAPGDRDHVIRLEPSWVSGRTIPMHQHDDGLITDGG